MTTVRIKGRSFDRKEIRAATQFFCESLLGKRLSKNIVINVNLVKKLSSDRGRMAGECVPLDAYTRARVFQICLDTAQSFDNLIASLAHECVHVKQFARGELSTSRYPVMKFLGGLYTEEESNYCLTPYETEATKKEGELFSLWMEYKKTMAICGISF